MPSVHTVKPCLCVKKGRGTADTGDALPLKGEPLSVKYHQRQPQQEDSGPNGIDCPSLTGILKAQEREKGMSRGLKVGGERREARRRSPRAPDPREAGGEARLGQPARLRRPRAARSALERPTAPRPP